MKTLLLALLLAASAHAQTVTVPQQQVTIPAQTIPAQSCHVGFFGGTCTIPAYKLPTIYITLPPMVLNVVLPSGLTVNFSCSGATFDGTKIDESHLVCTGVKQ